MFFVQLLSTRETAMNKTDAVSEPRGVIDYKDV